MNPMPSVAIVAVAVLSLIFFGQKHRWPALVLLLFAGRAVAQSGVTYATQAYDTPAEALNHLLPIPPECRDATGRNICIPQFISEYAENPRRVVWRPTMWIDPAVPGICLDETASRWTPCKTPPAGAYRIYMQPPPPMIIRPIHREPG